MVSQSCKKYTENVTLLLRNVPKCNALVVMLGKKIIVASERIRRGASNGVSFVKMYQHHRCKSRYLGRVQNLPPQQLNVNVTYTRVILGIYRYVMLNGHIPLSGKAFPLSGKERFLPKSQSNVMSMALYVDIFCKYLQPARRKWLANGSTLRARHLQVSRF